MYRVIIDADPIVYRAGFAAEEHHYHLVLQEGDGEPYEAYFQPYEDAKGNRVTAGAAMKAFLEAHPGVQVLDKERVVVPEPLENALHIVNETVSGIVAAAQERYKVGSDELDVRIILSGPGNFRPAIATIVPYKGNRDEDYKPHWYQQIRDHLTGRWGARVVEGREADDEVSIQGWGLWRDGQRFSYLIATIDKDLDQVPGMHYDYRQKVFYNITERDAEEAFWRQILTGDPTDNIPGGYKIGPATADKILAKLAERCGSAKNVEVCLWNGVVRAYEDTQKIEGCPYADKPARDVALETARLVYMQREPLELWTPPGEPKQYLEASIDD